MEILLLIGKACETYGQTKTDYTNYSLDVFLEMDV